MNVDNFEKVTRVEIIDAQGRSYVKYGELLWRIGLQDDDRTLKIFLTEKETK